MNASTMRLKEINVDTVRRILRISESMTKNSIAEMTGLSIASCGNILAELLESGEIYELNLAESTGGRPSRQFSYNFGFAHIAALYLRKEGDSNRLYSSVSDLAGNALIEEFNEFDDIRVDEIDIILRKYMSDIPSIRSVSIGIPGVVRNGVIGICDFPELAGFALKSYLEELFGVSVVLENDVNLAALGDFFNESSDTPHSLVSLYYPKAGIPGAGIVVNGNILKGYRSFAGEVSFLPLGIPLTKLGSLIDFPDMFIDTVSRTIQSIISVVDPQIIVLIGLAFTDEMFQEIKKKVSSAIPESHLPDFQFRPDIHSRLVRGLKHLAMRELSCGFELISTSENARSVL